MKSYFYRLLSQYLSPLIHPSSSVVEVSPQHTLLLEKLPARNKAILDPVVSKSNVDGAPFNSFTILSNSDSLAQFKPDCVLLNCHVHYSTDIQKLFDSIKGCCTNNTRIVVLYYNSLWRPLITLATRLGIRHKTGELNWISHGDIDNLLSLSDFELVFRGQHILVPFGIPVLSTLCNRYLARLPFFRLLSLVTIMVARPKMQTPKQSVPSVSVIVPVRNEEGNIEEILKRIPAMGPSDEIIFVEGGSQDRSWEVIQRNCSSTNPNIRGIQQQGKGKGDAVRAGFSIAKNSILMILDADLSVAPEELTKFYRALIEHKGELVIGSRLVYPMRPGAMRFLNILGNKFFAVMFSFVLDQHFKDTLCGTKVLFREQYEQIASQRHFFGDFDPFGDFDLIFGACKAGFKILEIPVHYYERTYGKTNIKRWSEGLLLLKMLLFAAKKLSLFD